MKNKRHARRVKRLALICTMCTIILVVSTYAWFVGMRVVNVSTFDVEIAATEGLYLSVDGKTWAETVSINQSNYADPGTSGVYNVDKGNTNVWTGLKDGQPVGLIPMSTVGEIDSSVSRLMMYEKGSLTTTEGGYRLMASRVDNHSTGADGKTTQGTGYVAFDLFVKNMSGNEYYTEFNQLNEEAIYLTRDSEVSVALTGTMTEEEKEDQLKTGIENSVRVAFAQIGRVIASTTSESDIQKITCTDGKVDGTGAEVTGICDRYAQIWEPNDKKHVTNAISWYNSSCVKRTGTSDESTGNATGFGYAKSGSTKTPCTVVTNESYSQTYPVGSVIDWKDYVDVYDGSAYNTFTKTINPLTTDNVDLTTTKISSKTLSKVFKASSNKGKLYEYDYFTDEEKLKRGIDRPTFMTLAPNSITKIRVYIYIEGQDVDNYDFASLGKKISVKFGFTKERFFGEDIGYEGPEGVPTLETVEN